MHYTQKRKESTFKNGEQFRIQESCGYLTVINSSEVIHFLGMWAFTESEGFI